MKFFDKKEEVLDIELTQYGKHLLSRGVLRPVFYAFFDDDIIYDSQYIGGGSSVQVEHSTKEGDRIRNVPRPHTQYSFGGVESNFDKIHNAVYYNDPFLDLAYTIELTETEKLEYLAKPPSAIDNYNRMALPLGTSQYNSDNLPAWDLKMMSGEITGSVLDYTGSSGIIKMPQLDIEVFYETEIKQLDDGNAISGDSSEDINIFPDGTYVEITKDYIAIDLSEHNSLFENENFELEAYEMVLEQSVDTNQLMEWTYRPLYFIDGEKITNDVFYKNNLRQKTDVTQDNVEYYFDLRVDDEITDTAGMRNNIITDIYKKKPKNDKEPC